MDTEDQFAPDFSSNKQHKAAKNKQSKAKQQQQQQQKQKNPRQSY